MRLTLISIIIIFGINQSIGSDNYKVGDQLYIWAKSGLNLREGPGTNFPIIGGISFGEKVEVIEKSNVPFTFTLISKKAKAFRPTKNDPINLRGNWVKIRLDSITGYIIDQYLLELNPKIIHPTRDRKFYFDIISIDTTWVDTERNNVFQPKFCLTSQHGYGISGKIWFGGNYYTQSYIFEGFTIEEVLIVFGAFYGKEYDQFSIRKNWKDELEISDSLTCEFFIKKEDSGIHVRIECGC